MADNRRPSVGGTHYVVWGAIVLFVTGSVLLAVVVLPRQQPAARLLAPADAPRTSLPGTPTPAIRQPHSMLRAATVPSAPQTVTPRLPLVSTVSPGRTIPSARSPRPTLVPRPVGGPRAPTITTAPATSVTRRTVLAPPPAPLPAVTPAGPPTPLIPPAVPPLSQRPAVRWCAGVVPPCPPRDLLPGSLLIADRGNNRLLEVNAAHQIVWSFPRPGDLRPRQVFLGPDDAFFTPIGGFIITNEEEGQTVTLIDAATHRLVWQYGHPGVRGSAQGYLNEPDDAYQLPNGVVTVADIRNCRILFLSPTGMALRQYGRTGVCVHDPPRTFASPNGDTPLPDGGMLVTEIDGSHVVRLSAAGRVLFDIALPQVAYPSDAQLLADGTILLADYSQPGGIVRVSSHGDLLWRYAPARPADQLNHPSLAIMLPNGLIATNDDWNDRVVLIDPVRQAIVWQYGVSGAPGQAAGYLNIPDGIDFRVAG